jgi:REP element-mobilizing transposase RayT
MCGNWLEDQHEFNVMPDHIHGIIELVNNPGHRENA